MILALVAGYWGWRKRPWYHLLILVALALAWALLLDLHFVQTPFGRQFPRNTFDQAVIAIIQISANMFVIYLIAYGLGRLAARWWRR